MLGQLWQRTTDRLRCGLLQAQPAVDAINPEYKEEECPHIGHRNDRHQPGDCRHRLLLLGQKHDRQQRQCEDVSEDGDDGERGLHAKSIMETWFPFTYPTANVPLPQSLLRRSASPSLPLQRALRARRRSCRSTKSQRRCRPPAVRDLFDWRHSKNDRELLTRSSGVSCQMCQTLLNLVRQHSGDVLPAPVVDVRTTRSGGVHPRLGTE